MSAVVPEMSSNALPAGLQTVKAFLRRPIAVISVVVILVIIIACAGAALLAPYGPLEQDLLAAMQGPTVAHPLGTDGLGRDVLSRLLWGGQPALLGLVLAVATFTVVGTTLGMIAGYLPGLPDRILSVITDVLMSLPGIVIMLAVLAVFRGNLFAAMLGLGLFSAGALARVVRAATRSAREELYVDAARVAGLSTPRILARHILPRLLGPIVVQVALFAGIALMVQSGLGFLNLGIQAPAPTWGGMLGEAAQVITQFPWLLVPSGAAIGLTVLAFGLIGDAVRDVTASSISRSGGFRARRRAPGVVPAARDVAYPDGAPLLEIRALRIAFRGRDGAAEVVHGVDFSVAPGEMLGLVGESGSGKTVSALALLGLLPANAEVTADELRIGGHDLRNASPAAFRTVRGGAIGLVSQEPMTALDPSFTVGAQLSEVVRRHSHGSRAAVRGQMLDLLADVRLPDPPKVALRYPHELSGGMAQRVAIAIALAGRPQLLIADEPTTALDVTVQAEILDLLRALRNDRGMTIVLVTHDLGVVADFCERVVVMRSGSVVEERTVHDLFADPRDEYTRSLIAATPSLESAPSARPAGDPA